MCVVSFPACPEAVADRLVAELFPVKDGDSTMENEENKVVSEEAEVAAVQETEPVIAESTPAPAEPEVEEEDEEEDACKEKAESESTPAVQAEEKEPVTETAEVKQFAEITDRLDQLINAMSEMMKAVAEMKQAEEEASVEKTVAEIKESDIGEGENKFTASADLEVSGNKYADLLTPRKPTTQFSSLL